MLPGNDNRDSVNFNLLSHHASIVTDNAGTFKEIYTYMVADAYFSKKPFVDKVLAAELHFISRFSDDSLLMYKFYGDPTGRKGRPKKFEGRVNIANPDKNYFDKEICYEDLTINSAVVYSKAFNREDKLAMAVFFKDR